MPKAQANTKSWLQFEFVTTMFELLCSKLKVWMQFGTPTKLYNQRWGEQLDALSVCLPQKVTT